METTPLCLNTRLRENKNVKIHFNFIEINVNDCLLCALHVMTSIIFHTGRPNRQQKVCHALGFYVSADFIFRILRSWKARFSHRSISPTSYVLMTLRCLEVSNRVSYWNKVKNFIFVESKFELWKLDIPIFISKLMCQSSLIYLFHFCSVNLIE